MIESTTNNTSTRRPTVDGLVSGIKSSDVIDALIGSERSATAIIEKNKKLNTARLEAVRSFNTKLLSAQLDLSTLKQSSTFQSRAATSNNTDALTISKSGSSAVPGNYILDVRKVATSHQLATAGQSSSDTVLAPGTLSFQIGSAPATALTFDSGGSLNDIAAAINNANAGVSATILNDGSANPYRLVLKADETGEDNEIILNSTGLSSLFTGAPLTELSVPTNAIVRIGSVSSFIDIEQASNTFSNVVPGVDFEAISLADDITINVKADTVAAKESITTFVDNLNIAIKYLKENSSFDAATGAGGILIGQSSLVSGLNRLINSMTGTVAGLPNSLNNFSAIGIRLNKTDGTFTIDKAVLNDKLATNPNGVMRLFNNSGTSSNPAVQFSYLNDKTKVNGPFTVNVTQPASQAVLTTTDLAPNTTINNTNNSLALSINNHPITVTLTNDDYTPDELAQHLHTVINAAVTSGGDNLTVSLSGNKLDIRSNQYGANQTLAIFSSSTALTALGLSQQNVTGTHVAGTINGVAGTGSGKILIGAIGSAAEGLSLVVSSVIPLNDVQVTATKGLGQLLTERFSTLTDNSFGSITSLDKTLTTNIADAQARITKADALLEKRRARYTQQFLTMEKLIQTFNSQGTTITNFINGLTRKES